MLFFISQNFTINLNTLLSGHGRSKDPSRRREDADAAGGRGVGGGRIKSERPRPGPGRQGEDPQDQGHARQSTILKMYATEVHTGRLTRL